MQAQAAAMILIAGTLGILTLEFHFDWLALPRVPLLRAAIKRSSYRWPYCVELDPANSHRRVFACYDAYRCLGTTCPCCNGRTRPVQSPCPDPHVVEVIVWENSECLVC